MLRGNCTMKLQDPVSLAMTPRQEYTFQFKKESQDPYFWKDLRKHLQKNAEYRKEKKQFRIAHHMSIEQSTLDFPKVYSETFLKDLDVFMQSHRELSIDELTRAFGGKWRGYYLTYGEEFIKRGFRERIDNVSMPTNK